MPIRGDFGALVGDALVERANVGQGAALGVGELVAVVPPGGDQPHFDVGGQLGAPFLELIEHPDDRVGGGHGGFFGDKCGAKPHRGHAGGMKSERRLQAQKPGGAARRLARHRADHKVSARP